MKMREVEKEYKEDSTKGTSLINPVNYKGDVMVQVWMDSRVLATICRWMESEGEIPRFLSHVVKMPLEMLADHLVNEKGIEMVDDTKKARVLLESRFHVQLNKGKRGRKNLMHNIVLSSKRGTDSESRGEAIDYTRHEVEPIKESFEEQRDRWRKEQAAKKQELEEIMEKETQKAIVGGLVVKDDGTPITNVSGIVSVKEGMSGEEWRIDQEERAKRDAEKLKLEQSAEIDESNIVRS